MISVSTLTSIIEQFLPEPHAGLLSGILFGVKTSLDPSLKDALVTTGTLHIVALSGMNITMLTSLVNISLLWLFPRKIASGITIGVIIGFILFVGPSAPVIRAAIMGGITLLGIIFGKNVWALWSWGVAVVLMLGVKPLWITDLSFQLSVLASLGLILFGNPVHPPSTGSKMYRESWKQSLISLLTRELRVTLAAQTLTIPVLLFSFGRLSFISPLTNILIVWTLPYITVLGFLVILGGIIFSPVGQMFAWGSWIFLEYVIQIIQWTAKIPFASITL